MRVHGHLQLFLAFHAKNKKIKLMSISPLFKSHFSFSCTGCASAGKKAHSKAQKKETEINTEKKAALLFEGDSESCFNSSSK